MGGFHLLCGESAALSLRKTWKMQEVNLMFEYELITSDKGKKTPPNVRYDEVLMLCVFVTFRSCIASRDPYCGWVSEGACRQVVGNIK